MPRRISLLLNLLIVLGLTLSSVLVGSSFSAGTGQARGSAPAIGSETVDDPALAGKRAQRKQGLRQDRNQDRQRKRAQADRKRDDNQKERKQDRKKSATQAQEPGRVGDWQEQCSGPETIQLRGSELCTHGPDAAPAGFDVTLPVPLLSDTVAADQAAAIACDGDGQSGYRTQVLYVRGSDRPDNYAASVPSIMAWAAETDVIFRASAAETGPTRSLRFVQDPATCRPTAANVVLSPAGDGNFSTTINELWAKGYNRQDRIYLMFVDAYYGCGVGTWWDDDRVDGNLNYNNYGESYARVDRGCWGGDVAAHEVMHNLGGVQDSAPHSSKGAHCIDEYDIMCYSDYPYYPEMQTVCPNPASGWTLLDCNHDDYYNTNAAPGSYLATHWNPANNQFLTNAPPLPPLAPPPTVESPSIDDTTTATSKKNKKHKKGKGKGKHKGKKRR